MKPKIGLPLINIDKKDLFIDTMLCTISLVPYIFNTTVFFLDINNVKGYWKNHIFHFTNGKVKTKSVNLFCFVELRKGIIIFNDKKNFTYLGDHINTLKKHVVTNKVEGRLPYYYSKTYRREFVKVISIFGDFMFSEDQNKIIEE